MDISVIVPVFNVSAYIDKTVDSLINQDFKGKYEIILVDDGSTDDSLVICEQLASKNHIIRVLSKKNGGVSSARNFGMENAIGHLITFVDGDDIVSFDYLTKLYSALSDGSLFSRCFLISIASYDYKFDEKRNSIESLDCFNYLEQLLLQNTDCSACCKLFRRDDLKNLRFVEGKSINEDKFFLFQLLISNLDSFVSTNPSALYGAFMRANSASRSSYNSKFLDMLYFSNLMVEECKNKANQMVCFAEFNDMVTHLAVLKKIVRTKSYKTEKKTFFSIRNRCLQLYSKRDKRFYGKYMIEFSILNKSVTIYRMLVKVYSIFNSK